jgi:hypothetical protein
VLSEDCAEALVDFTGPPISGVVGMENENLLRRLNGMGYAADKRDEDE